MCNCLIYRKNNMNKLFNPKGFLQIGGAVLLLVGILGYVGIIGPTADKSIFGSTWWFDNAENLAHTVLGIVGILASFVLPGNLQKMLVLVLALLGFGVGIYNFIDTQLLGANLESPADLILHLVVGAWALAAAMMGRDSTMSPMKSSM
jgi:hypothetical protein